MVTHQELVRAYATSIIEEHRAQSCPTLGISIVDFFHLAEKIGATIQVELMEELVSQKTYSAQGLTLREIAQIKRIARGVARQQTNVTNCSKPSL